MKQVEEERKKRTQQRTRRWGDTRIKYEEENQDKQPFMGGGLKTIKRSDLLVINNKSTDGLFINRFNQLIQSFFFPLLVPLRINHKKLMRKEVFLLSNIFSLMTTYLQCARIGLFSDLRNSLLFYRMVEEALDYVEEFKDIVDLNFTRSLLQCVLKITILVNRDLLMQYPLVLGKLVQASRSLAGIITVSN